MYSIPVMQVCRYTEGDNPTYSIPTSYTVEYIPVYTVCALGKLHVVLST